MGLWDKLRQASNSLRKLRLSLGPKGYFHYKRERKYARKQAEGEREHLKDSAEREHREAERRREDAERERGYEERYTRERERGAAPQRTEQADEIEPDR